MIVLYIRNCVIAMSRYFYDDSYLHYDQKQDNYEEEVRKFYQSIIPNKSEFLQTFQESEVKKEYINFEVPEVYGDVYNIYKISQDARKFLSALLFLLVKYKGYINICIVFLNDEYIKKGVYFLGLSGDLYWIKGVDNKLIENLGDLNATFTINYYIDIKNAVFLEKSYGFINALKKIGSATEYINDLCRKENCNANEIVFNPNIITKLMGLNLINQLYITSGVITIL